MIDTKINLDNEKVYQLSGDTLYLSGTTFVKNIEYITDNNNNFNKLSLTDVNYVTGKTNNLLNKITTLSGSTGYLSAGVIGNSNPILTDNNNGTATINNVEVLLYKTPDFNGYLYKYDVSGDTFTFTDNSEEYVCINYNNGNPIMYKETNINNINNSNIIIIFVCWRQGNTIHSLNFERIGLGLSNKLQNAEYNKEIYNRSNEGGLIISELTSPTNRTIFVSSGIIYTGSIKQLISEFNSSGDTLTETTVTNGTWSYNNVSVYDNTKYNPPTGPIALDNDKWTSIWFYRSIGNIKQVFYVFDTNEYNDIIDSELSNERNDLPILLKKHCLLIGRVLIKKNASTGTIQSIFTKHFKSSGALEQQLNNKINVVSNATENNVAVFNNNGSIIDSGINKALIYAGLIM